MTGTRRFTRNAGIPTLNPSAPQEKPAPSAGSKRKLDSKAAPKAKRGKKGNEKEQTTIEASMPLEEKDGESKDVEMKDEAEPEPANTSNGVDEVARREEEIRDQEDMRDTKGEELATDNGKIGTNGNTDDEGKKEQPQKNGFDALMDHGSKDVDKNVTEEGTGSKVSAADNAVEDSAEREKAMPSNIL